MSLERNIIEMMKINEHEDRKPVKYVAFGRTLPIYLRHPKPSLEIDSVDPKFPEILRSREVLFKGIYHLR